MVTIILENALNKVQEQFGPVKLRFASYDVGAPQFYVLLPPGLTFCQTCSAIFPGTARYCDAHSHAPDPRTATSRPA